MREFQRKRKVRRFLYSRLTLFVLLIALALLIKASWGVFERERGNRANLEHAQEELAALEARAASLEEKILRLKSPEGVEAEIREQFQVAKPGEKMVVVVPDTNGAEVVPEPTQSLVSRLFDFFR